MTTEELKAERSYRIQERLGIMCGSGEPAIEQIEIAEREADEWQEKYCKQSDFNA